MTLQRLVLVLTFVLALWAIGETMGGWEFTDWQFWCLALLFWAAEIVGRITGRIEGIIDYIDMPDTDQQRIKRALKSAREESNG